MANVDSKLDQLGKSVKKHLTKVQAEIAKLRAELKKSKKKKKR